MVSSTLALLAQSAAGQLYDLQTIGVSSLQDNAFGYSCAVIGDVDGDGRDDFVVGDPLAGTPWPWLFVTTPNDRRGKLAVISGASGATLRTVIGLQNHELGYSVARIGDINGDGFAEYAAGAPGVGPGGRVYVYSGIDGSILHTINGVAQYFYPSTESERLGEAVVGPGDLNLDGIPDIGVGAPRSVTQCGTLPFCLGRGGSAAFYSGATGQLLFKSEGTTNGGGFGRSLGNAGDVNADGVGDVLIGAPIDASNGAPPYARVMSGATGASLFLINGTLGSSLGLGLASLGDLDADGRSEFAIGAPGLDTNSLAGAITIHSGLSGAAIATVTVPGPGAWHFGSALCTIGDVNADGVPEILVSSLAGVVRLVSPATGGILSNWVSTTASSAFGCSLAGPANLDGDAIPDFVVGQGKTSPPNAPPGWIHTYSSAITTPLHVIPGELDPFGGALNDAVVIGDVNLDTTPDIAWASGAGRMAFTSGATGTQIGLVDLAAARGSPWAAARLLAIGDITDDGVPDVVAAGLYSAWGTPPFYPRFYAFSGATRQPIYSVTQPGPCGLSGWMTVSTVGDEDGDGKTDFAIAHPYCSGLATTGEVRVYSGANGALIRTIQNVATGISATLSLAGGGDLDGDQVDDIVVGAPYVPLGSSTGPGEVSFFSGATGGLILRTAGTGSPTAFGFEVASVSDVNGDGVRDVIASSVRFPPSATVNDVKVLSGLSGSVLATAVAPVANGSFGARLAAVGDADGDGSPDFIVSSPEEVSGANFGAVRLYSASSGALIATTFGPPVSSGFGSRLNGAGDLNADGLGDGLVMAQSAPTSPRVRVVSFAGIPKDSQAIGTGCGSGAPGSVPVLSAYGGDANVTQGNASFGLIVSNTSPSAVIALLIGSSTQSWNGIPLPLSLAPFGFAGCSLFVSPDIIVQLTANSLQVANAKLPIPLPQAPGFAGIALAFQAYDSHTSPGTLTRGLRIIAQ